MKSYYFTFGQSHQHERDGFIFDKDLLLEIKAKNWEEARRVMGVFFENKWSMQYKEKPDLQFFSRGCLGLNWKKIINNKLKNAN